MTTNKKARLNVSKAVMGVSFTTLAGMGSATGSVWIVGAAALPLGIFAASDTIASLLHNADAKQEAFLELPIPAWWLNDVPTWEGVCAEIETRLPHILQKMAEHLQGVQEVVTMDVVRKSFIVTLSSERLTWVSNPQEQSMIGEVIATPLLQKIGEVLRPLVIRLQQEAALKDIRTIAANSEKIAHLLELLRREPTIAFNDAIVRPGIPPFDDVLLLSPEYFVGRYEDQHWLLK